MKLDDHWIDDLRISEIIQMIYLIKYRYVNFININKNNESYDKIKNFIRYYRPGIY